VVIAAIAAPVASVKAEKAATTGRRPSSPRRS
jgi:hypothetical protein